MRTYARAHGCGRDWWAAIAKAKEGITWDEHGALWAEARSWVTCACGNQCSSIPRTITGQPHDVELARLGMRFAAYINTGEWSFAEDVLREIDGRAKILMKQLEES